MEKNSKGVVTLIIILVVIIMGLVGYIVYDKSLNNEKKCETNTTNNVCTNNDSMDKEYNKLFKEIKDIYNVVYDYQGSVNTYCGESESSTHQTNEGLNDRVSTQFKTYDEMYNYLKGYMSEEVIKSFRFYERKHYIEEDGKLYCANLGKGSPFNVGDVTISIDNIEDNKISVIAIQELIGGDYPIYKKIKLTYELINDNYIVTSYEEVNTEY